MAKTFHCIFLSLLLLLLTPALSQILTSSAASGATAQSQLPAPLQPLDNITNPQNLSSHNNTINQGQLSVLSNLLSKTYSELIASKPSTSSAPSKDIDLDSLSQALMSLQKEYDSNNQQMKPDEKNSSNIDNGLNNKINGAQNIIKKGDNNQINGFANDVNGSNNSISGKNNRVVGEGNVILDSSIPIDMSKILANMQKSKTVQHTKSLDLTSNKKEENSHSQTVESQLLNSSEINKAESSQQTSKSNYPNDQAMQKQQSKPNKTQQESKKSDIKQKKSGVPLTNSVKKQDQNLSQQHTPQNTSQTDQKNVENNQVISNDTQAAKISLGDKQILKLFSICLIILLVCL